MNISIQRLDEQDLPEVVSLLTSNKLTSDDLNKGKINFFGIKKESKLIACIGLESCQGVGLLRSLVVDDDFRAQGLARALVDCLETEAKMQGFRSLYLLTTSAGAYFLRLGYSQMDREEVPEGVRASEQFSALCPDSAEVLFKAI
ncbi:arsenic resistance N-acetyltransferase ArsN2 [Reichenbachiella ulvae]|uniref:Arsenic resistance N-acetyltransferase ArsN2 n=1 Tax=Reichenbachiella ulvae TaxID=2980104 RepID=A0ABT3CQ90_9BACT|nr:arsenic resistance N-acetyltransferase ArsN2 [Reichenbachiella ulvae]MCV9385866.1 arsenic resistance N-acetyltransferase ArsN2 [Reichenbachiella ulvae]